MLLSQVRWPPIIGFPLSLSPRVRMGVGEGVPNLFAANLTGATRQPRRRIMRPASQARHRAMRQVQAGFHAAQLSRSNRLGKPTGCNSSAPGPSPASGSSELKHLETQTVGRRSCTSPQLRRDKGQAACLMAPT